MGAGIIAKLALHFGMPERGVKIALIGLAIIVAVISLGIAKCTYDRSVVDKASAKQAASQRQGRPQGRRRRRGHQAQPTMRASPRNPNSSKGPKPCSD
jgi:hypothetical protein